MFLSLYACHGDYRELGDGYLFVNWSIALKCDNMNIKCLVYPFITEYNYNDKFIIAHLPLENLCYEMVIDDINNAKGHEKDFLKQKFEKMKHIKDCYWIILKEDGRTFGPMSKSEFYVKKQYCPK